MDEETIHKEAGAFLAQFIVALRRGRVTHAVDDVGRRLVGFKDVSNGASHWVSLTTFKSILPWFPADWDIKTVEGRESLFGSSPRTAAKVVDIQTGEVVSLSVGGFVEIEVKSLTREHLADAFAEVERWDVMVDRVAVNESMREKHFDVLGVVERWGAALVVDPEVPDGEIHLRSDGTVKGDDALWAVIRINLGE